MFLTVLFSFISLYAIDVNVSTNGVDEAKCSPCKTIAFASGFGTGSVTKSVSLTVGVGQYEETNEVKINGSLEITGENQAECFLIKQNNALFKLFNLIQAYSNLSLTNLTLVFTNQSDVLQSYFVYSNSTSISLIFSACKITQKKELATIFGYQVYIYGNVVSTIIMVDKCHFYNITQEWQSRPVIYGNLESMCITDTSFTRIRGEVSTFCATDSRFFSMSGCFVSDCGECTLFDLMRGNFTYEIQSSVFFNSTNFLGLLCLHACDVTFSNLSFTSCEPAVISIFTRGTYHILRSRFFNITSSSRSQGAVDSLSSYTSNTVTEHTLYIQQCVFAGCSTKSSGGAALRVNSFNLTIIESIFVGNQVRNTVGHDIYANNSKSIITFIDAYSDQPSVKEAFTSDGGQVIKALLPAKDLCGQMFPSTGPALLLACTNCQTSASRAAPADDNTGKAKGNSVLVICVGGLVFLVVVLVIAVFLLIRRQRVKGRDRYSPNDEHQTDQALRQRQIELRGGEVQQGEDDSI